jgi:hypothetical protein
MRSSRKFTQAIMNQAATLSHAKEHSLHAGAFTGFRIETPGRSPLASAVLNQLDTAVLMRTIEYGTHIAPPLQHLFWCD